MAMASQVRDRGNPPPGRIIHRRDMCVYKAVDDKGDRRLIINAPEPESRAVTDVIHGLFPMEPKELSDDFERSAMLIRIATFLLVAASENLLLEDMKKIRTDFDKLYRKFSKELQKLMAFSYDMFEMFKMACYYYDEGNVVLGGDTLDEMQEKSTKTQETLTSLSQDMKNIEANVSQMMTKLQTRRGQLGPKFELYVVLLSECTSSVAQIHSFLTDQIDQLGTMQEVFNLEEHCIKIQETLNKATFQKLTNDETPGGFLYRIHGIILRCVAAKQLSGSYTRELASRKAAFTQMMAASPAPTIAQEDTPHLITEFNNTFPKRMLNRGIVEKIEKADWSNPPPLESRCAIL